MKGALLSVLLGSMVGGLATTHAYAETTVEEFEIEGLVSPASPKALTEALEEELKVKVAGYNISSTATGWPTVRVEFESGATTREEIAQVIEATSDPTGGKYKVHKGPPDTNKPLLEEETQAIAVLGPIADEVPTLTNPIAASPESAARGETLYTQFCTKCHGANGNGRGPAAHGFTTFPRELWVWSKADQSADGYLFSMITDGRTDMPPWGVVLSEDERWDLINYIRTFEAPTQQ